MNSYPMPTMHYDPTGTNQLTATSSNIAANLYGIGDLLVLIGLMGAFTLLMMQGLRFRAGQGHLVVGFQ